MNKNATTRRVPIADILPMIGSALNNIDVEDASLLMNWK